MSIAIDHDRNVYMTKLNTDLGHYLHGYNYNMNYN